MIADIYRETRQGKGLHKRQVLRLLMAANRSNKRIDIVEMGVSGNQQVVNITLTDAINDLTSDVLGGDMTRADINTERRINNVTDERERDSRDEEVDDAIAGGGDRFYAE